MTFKEIDQKIKEHFGVDPKKKNRQQDIIKVRYLMIHCLFYYSHEIVSYPKIAKFMNYAQHGTVMYALEEFDNFIVSDKKFKNKCDIFIASLGIEKIQKLDFSDVYRVDVLEHKIKMFKKQIEVLSS